MAFRKRFIPPSVDGPIVGEVGAILVEVLVLTSVEESVPDGTFVESVDDPSDEVVTLVVVVLVTVVSVVNGSTIGRMSQSYNRLAKSSVRVSLLFLPSKGARNVLEVHYDAHGSISVRRGNDN